MLINAVDGEKRASFFIHENIAYRESELFARALSLSTDLSVSLKQSHEDVGHLIHWLYTKEFPTAPASSLPSDYVTLQTNSGSNPSMNR